LEQADWDHLIPKIHTLSEAPIFIDDTPALNEFELRAKCRRLKMNYDVQLIIIDYLQLMHAATENRHTNREQEISQISRSLKSIAKELDVPIIALSQLSRAVEVRGGLKRPQLSDLRESGAIEQDADLVLFLWRPEYYGIDQDNEGNSLQGLAEVNVAKHRNGPTGSVMLRFINRFAKFVSSESTSMPDITEKKPTTLKRPSKMNDDDNPFLD
jgi:replicative DNA helicase